MVAAPRARTGRSPPPPGLTTTKAPFIEEARAHGEIYIHQPYELYSAENQDTWARLLGRMHHRWERYANERLPRRPRRLRFPRSASRARGDQPFLRPLTGFVARPVSGYVPSYVFFDCLSRREFPTTITIRDGAQIDYLPEPDIFHDVAGHVPDAHRPGVRRGAGAVRRVRGRGGRAARRRSPTSTSGCAALTSNIRAMSRFFWFSVEFGLMRGARRRPAEGLRQRPALSFGEIAHAIDSPEVQRYPFQIEWVVNQAFEIDHYQPLLFIVDSFDHLYALVDDARAVDDRRQARQRRARRTRDQRGRSRGLPARR